MSTSTITESISDIYNNIYRAGQVNSTIDYANKDLIVRCSDGFGLKLDLESFTAGTVKWTKLDNTYLSSFSEGVESNDGEDIEDSYGDEKSISYYTSDGYNTFGVYSSSEKTSVFEIRPDNFNPSEQTAVLDADIYKRDENLKSSMQTGWIQLSSDTPVRIKRIRIKYRAGKYEYPRLYLYKDNHETPMFLRYLPETADNTYRQSIQSISPNIETVSSGGKYISETPRQNDANNYPWVDVRVAESDTQVDINRASTKANVAQFLPETEGGTDNYGGGNRFKSVKLRIDTEKADYSNLPFSLMNLEIEVE